MSKRTAVLICAAFVAVLWYLIDGRYSYTPRSGTSVTRTDRITGITVVCGLQGWPLSHACK
jgi:hypothetical protein